MTSSIRSPERRPATAPTAAGAGDRDSWGRGLRVALKALTSRGRAFVAGGLTASLCGVVLGERDLVRIGALVTLIPLVTAIAAARSRHQLGLVRRVGASVIEVGQAAIVTLDLSNVGRRTGLLLLEEQVPWTLGQRPRFLVGWLATGRSRHVQYSIQSDLRGRYEVGPLLVRASDPFGMLSMFRAFPRTTTVVVIPSVEALPSISPISAGAGVGDDRPRPFTSGTEADSSVRDYRRGDDLRRVHWPSSARTGELMVRREEQPRQSRCTVFVDNRAIAHRGTGPDSSLERAVTIAASIAVHLNTLGYQVQVLAADGTAFPPESTLASSPTEGGSVTGPLLEFLAALPSTESPAIVIPQRGEHRTGGLFVAVLGELDDLGSDSLVRAQTPGGTFLALCLDVATWASRSPREDESNSVPFLRSRGWKAVKVARGDSLPMAWKALGP